jgi:hypothetical protein
MMKFFYSTVALIAGEKYQTDRQTDRQTDSMFNSLFRS